jgi:phenylalanyl-tRNA synthetase beta chain
MHFSLQWLKRYVDLDDVNIDHLANRFTLSVAELEGYEKVGAGLESICVARIESCEPHPNADKLQVCQVNDGSEQLRTIVCGAPNARPGLVTALAMPGVKFGSFKIKVAKVRGVESHGMLCSAQELGLGNSHEGIWELPSDWQPGSLLSEHMPVEDIIFEVDNKSITHRPDLWGHYGIAREVAGLLKRPLRALESQVTLGQEQRINVQLQENQACSRYCALTMEQVEVTAASPWMQVLLHRCGTRPINNIVDCTNFVMLELGQPLHAFDARQIKGQQITIRYAHDEEKVTTLDEQEHSLLSSDLLICDAERPVALAGVMGLANSEVQDDTQNLVLEAAHFKSDVVRKTAVRLGLRTEASARFEKSLDPALPSFAAFRFCHLLQSMCPQAQITSALSDVWSSVPETITIETSVSYINTRLGTQLPAQQIRDYLTSIEFQVTKIDEDQISVQVPSFRATKDISIPEDLIEEVGRLYGYDNIIPCQPAVEIPKPYRHSARTLQQKIRRILSFQAAAHEVRNYSFDSEPFLDKIGRSSQNRLQLKNPLSSEQIALKTSLLPNMLASLQRSLAYTNEALIYEIGRVFQVEDFDPNTELTARADLQPFHVSTVLWKQDKHIKTPHKHDLGYDAIQDLAYAELKGVCEILCAGLNTQVVYKRSDGKQPVWLHPARCALVCTTKGDSLGYIGNLHPDVCEALQLGTYTAALEWDLTIWDQMNLSYGEYKAISKFPSIHFDLSVILDENISYDEVKALMLNAHRSWVKGVECVAVYRGDPIPQGQKSITFKIQFQNDKATLEMEKVNKVVDRLMKRLKDELNAWVRL